MKMVEGHFYTGYVFLCTAQINDPEAQFLKARGRGEPEKKYTDNLPIIQ